MLRALTLGTAAAAAVAAGAGDGESFLARDWFPLATGAVWRYEGTATVPTVGVYEMVNVPVRVEMRVIEVRRWGAAELLLMEGSPDDAAWSLEGATSETGLAVTASRYGLLCVANKIFRVEDDDCEEVTLALSRGGYVDEAFLAGGGPQFEFPLYAGARFGPYPQLPREDGWYSWRCSGAEVRGGRTEYELVYDTGPDETRVTFVRGVGVVRYEYAHRGTPQRILLELTEYLPPQE